MPHPDAPHPSGEDRYAVYRVARQFTQDVRRRQRIAETSEEGLGMTLTTLLNEGEFDGYRVGILDRETRTWIVNPFPA